MNEIIFLFQPDDEKQIKKIKLFIEIKKHD